MITFKVWSARFIFTLYFYLFLCAFFAADGSMNESLTWWFVSGFIAYLLLNDRSTIKNKNLEDTIIFLTFICLGLLALFATCRREAHEVKLAEECPRKVPKTT